MFNKIIMTKKPTYEELEQRIKELEQAEIELKRSEELFCGLFSNMTSGSAIYAVINDGSKGSDYIVKKFNNITERKKIEQSLYESEKRFKLMFMNAPMPYQSLDENGNFLDVNQAYLDVLGYSHEELIGKNFGDILHPDWVDHFKENFPKFKAIGEIVGVEFEMVKKNGTRILVFFNGKIQRDADGIFQRTHCIFQDITEKKQAEAKQKELEAINLRLQKAESLGQMAGGIAHLFNNYLYAVSGNLELALDDLPEESLIREKLMEALKAARRCSDVSGSMLTYLGQSFAKTESFDIGEFCRKSLPDIQLSVHKNIVIETDLSNTELTVIANPNQMQQVLNHLITNACESIGENKGGISLSLTTRTIPASDISKLHIFPVDCKPSADTYACVEVTDTGCGIPTEDIHKLFDPFFTTKFTGRGLGLPVVLGIVKSWGGMIGVTSEVGHGSSFMVFLPLSVDASISQIKKSVQSPQAKPFSTVLLVDDHPAVLRMTTVMLKKMGFEVISASDGVEAVELFKQHKESIGCLITDLSMPELDGWGTLAEIRKIKPDIPAILASGYDEAFAMSRIDSEKPQAFLHKPYLMSDLKSALGQAGFKQQ